MTYPRTRTISNLHNAGAPLRQTDQQVFSTMRKGTTVFAGAVVFVAVILTAGAVALAVTVSPWWYIAVAICGGYSLITTVWMFIMNRLMKAAERWS
jgi:fatty acid desaturase